MSRTEWVLGNGLGGFAMGTVSGIPSRRYHGWLVGSARPPIARVMALSSVAEWLVLLPGAAGGTSEQRFELSSYRFSGATGGVINPQGIESLQRFEKGGSWVRWDYGFGLIKASREIHPIHGQNAALIRYRVRTGGHAARLELRPLLAMRDFHGPLLGDEAGAERYRLTPKPTGFEVVSGGLHLTMAVGGMSSGAVFVPEPVWWHNFEYVREAERGLDAHEDLFCPGIVQVGLPSFPAVSGDDLEHVIDVVATFWSDAGIGAGRERAFLGRASDAVDANRARLEGLVTQAVTTVRGRRAAEIEAADRDTLAGLVAAGDAFVVRRATLPGLTGVGEAVGGAPGSDAGTAVSVIAGYPWFGDWGRDTMISLRGLFLDTGRHAEASRVLDTFARFTVNGLTPNCFDDTTGEPQYNTIDASLWFVHAACDYVRATGDRAGFMTHMHAACVQILEKYRTGTDYGIAMDEDGLIRGGNLSTALTWMDAKRDGVVFTPRDGKPVEIQALWYNALLSFADLVDQEEPRRARELRQIAAKAGASFTKLFWDPARGYLADRLVAAGDAWAPDWTIRPNQIFAAGLPHSPLTPEMRRAVVASVRARLLTPMGLRTLDPKDARYIGRYRGPLFERDRAYHNGTVWPWLIGPYAQAVLRSGKDSGDVAGAAAEARAAIAPLLNSLTQGLAAGSIPEIFDGDTPPPGVQGFQRPDGCMAQAWSIAQLVEALVAILEAESPAKG